MDKAFWQSKTFWTSVAGVAYGIGGYFSGNLDLQAAVVAVQVALSAMFVRVAIK